MSLSKDKKPVGVIFLDHENNDLSVELFDTVQEAVAAIEGDEDNRKAIRVRASYSDGETFLDVDYHT